MPRGIHNWTAEDVVRFLKDRGFIHNHTRGSHMYYVGRYGGSVRQVCVPFHAGRSIDPRVLKSIIRQSGVSQNEWTS
ncbi:MAG: type II toxin-antitoxin system HicA family toxin [Patescibacteria group bacterium]|nr:type II toxin-antitoxin system HicA family toxin [Patescibacteria group bacterium]